MILAAIIPGDPVPQGRARISNGHHVMAPKSRDWRALAVAAIGWQWKHRPPVDADVAVSILVVVKRPASRPAWVDRAAWASGERLPARCKGDVDNFTKAGMDALVDARVLVDDHLVTDLDARKRYAAVGESPRMEIRVALVASAGAA